MGIKLYREYRIKSYLNARHYIIINGNKGEVHPHTWEFSFIIRIGRSEFTEFSTFEKGITDYLEPYQNAVINELEPFDSIVPTLENMTDFFSEDFYQVIQKIGGKLMQIEASETPTRSYILDLSEREDGEEKIKEEILSDVMDAVIDDIIK